jgi:hypothetical protein
MRCCVSFRDESPRDPRRVTRRVISPLRHPAIPVINSLRLARGQLQLILALLCVGWRQIARFAGSRATTSRRQRLLCGSLRHLGGASEASLIVHGAGHAGFQIPEPPFSRRRSSPRGVPTRLGFYRLRSATMSAGSRSAWHRGQLGRLIDSRNPEFRAAERANPACPAPSCAFLLFRCSALATVARRGLLRRVLEIFLLFRPISIPLF